MPVGLDYSIWSGQTSGLGSSLSDLVRLPRRALSARLPEVLAWRAASKDAELLMLRHENAVPRRQTSRGARPQGRLVWGPDVDAPGRLGGWADLPLRYPRLARPGGGTHCQPASASSPPGSHSGRSPAHSSC